MSVARQHIPIMRQWTGWKAGFSAWSAPMAAQASVNTATEDRCFLCGPCLDVTSRTISGASWPDGKRPLGRPRRRWVDNIEMDLREVGWDGGDWIDLAQDRDRWRAYVNAVMNLRVP
jgi:hypothetical protein